MLACVFGLAACGSDDEALEPLALRDGAALVHDFGATRAYEEVVVQDLARRGSRVVMLVVRDRIAMVDPFTGPVHAYTPAYFVSDDVGLSWREVDIRPLTNGDRWLRAEAIYPVSLVFDGEDLYELVYDWEDTEGLANFLHLTHIYRLDLDAGTRRLVGTLRLDEWFLQDDGDLLTYELENVTGSDFRARLRRIDLATAKVVAQDDVPFQWPAHGCTLGLWRDTGDGARLTCHNPLLGHCDLYATVPLRITPEIACLPPDTWPYEDDEDGRNLSLGRFIPLTQGSSPSVEQVEVVGRWSGNDTVIASSATLRQIPVGPGELHHRYARDGYGRDAHRFGELVALTERGDADVTTTTLYRRVGDRYQGSGLPTRPCVVGGSCGYRPDSPMGGRVPSVLEWAEPLGTDYLMVYIINVRAPSTGMSQQRIYSLRATPAPVDVTNVTSPLLASCGRASACFGRVFDIEECLRTTAQGTFDETRLAAFEAATDCAALAEVLPDVALWSQPCTEPGPACIGEVTTGCSDGERWVGMDCARLGASCLITAAGATCSEVVVPDVPEPACVAADTTVCVGDAVYACAGAGTAYGTPSQHCARTPGWGCVAGRCEPLEATCDALDARCEDDVLSFCHRGVRLAIDCGAVGARCDAEGYLKCE